MQIIINFLTFLAYILNLILHVDSFTKDQNIDWYKLKVFADDTFWKCLIWLNSSLTEKKTLTEKN